MAGFIQIKMMKQLRNAWLKPACEEFNKYRIPKGEKPVTIQDCITLTFYLFNFQPPNSKAPSKETGAIACTWTCMKCPPEALEADEREKLHKLCDTLKLEQGYNINDIKDISCTLNFHAWSIKADVTLKQIDPETGKHMRDSQIWK